MKITMIKCDRCGSIIEEGKQYRLVAPEGDEKDLCYQCVTEILIPKPVKVALISKLEEEPKNKRKKRVDHGKIHALHEAGWKNVDIAMDVKCSEQTVYNVLKRAQESDDAVGRSDD